MKEVGITNVGTSNQHRRKRQGPDDLDEKKNETLLIKMNSKQSGLSDIAPIGVQRHVFHA